MSLQFSDTTNFKGIVQIGEKEMGFNRGDISGDANKLKEFTADVNLAWDDYIDMALKSSGTWQFDDSNHDKYPIIKANLVSGQNDYSFTTDGEGSLILDIYKVGILQEATGTLYEEIFPFDVQKGDGYSDLFTEDTNNGIPYRYDKTANGIFLDPAPNYSATSGIKVYINREASYFVSTDTTKKPGCPGIHHKYFALKPAHDYARRNSLANSQSLLQEVLIMEDEIMAYFAKRSKDEEYEIGIQTRSFR